MSAFEEVVPELREGLGKPLVVAYILEAELGAELTQNALECIEPMPETLSPLDAVGWLIGGFTWATTKQGHNFWGTIHNKLIGAKASSLLPKAVARAYLNGVIDKQLYDKLMQYIENGTM